MGQTKLRAADRADERRDGAESGGSAGRLGAILHRLAVSLAAMSLDGHQFVEVIIEEHDLAVDLAAA